MKCAVLKSFPYAHDGARTEMVSAGEDREIRDELVNGLAAAGYIKPPAVQRAPENQVLAGAPQVATDTTPQRERRKPRG